MTAALFLLAAASAFPMADLRIGIAEPAFAPAASRLSDILGRIYGTTVPTGAVGNIRFEKTDWTDDQRYEIRTTGEDVTLRAAGAKGASYAAADFLLALGYRCFAPTAAWEILPANPPRTVTLERNETPAFRRRGIWPWYGVWPEFRTGRFADLWNFANRMGGERVEGGHSYGFFVRSEKAFFAEHPECLALVKGERKGDKLCISNPLLRERFAAWAVRRQAEHPDAFAVSVDPSDGGGWCECPACAKLGTPSDRAVILANAAAKACAAAKSDGKVSILAYNLHSPPPSVAVEPNVFVSVANGFIREGWDFDRLLAEWGKRVGTLGVREYWYARYEPGSGQATDPAGLCRMIAKYRAANALYLNAEGDDAWAPAMIGYNLAAALLWNPTADPKAVVSDFFRTAFPNTGCPMREFFRLLDGGRRRPLSEDLLARMYGALAEALPQASGAERERILQLVGYTRFCERLYLFQSQGSDANFTALLESAMAIKPYRLVHTLCLRRRAKDFGKRPGEIAAAFDWKTPRTNDWEKVLAEGVAVNHRLNFEPIDFSDDLVPFETGAAAPAKCALRSRSRQAFYLWSDGKPFEMEVTGGLIAWYRNRGNVRLSLVQIGGESETGELETEVFADASVPPDGEPHRVTLVPKHAGLHRLVGNDGGDNTSYAFPTNMAVAVPVKGGMPDFRSSFSFFVPKGAKSFGFYLKGNGALIGPDGQVVESLRRHNGHKLIDVPVGADGRVWCIRNQIGVFRPLTAPAILNLNPSVLLVPKECK